MKDRYYANNEATGHKLLTDLYNDSTRERAPRKKTVLKRTDWYWDKLKPRTDRILETDEFCRNKPGRRYGCIQERSRDPSIYASRYFQNRISWCSRTRRTCAWWPRSQIRLGFSPTKEWRVHSGRLKWRITKGSSFERNAPFGFAI